MYAAYIIECKRLNMEVNVEGAVLLQFNKQGSDRVCLTGKDMIFQPEVAKLIALFIYNVYTGWIRKKWGSGIYQSKQFLYKKPTLQPTYLLESILYIVLPSFFFLSK